MNNQHKDSVAQWIRRWSTEPEILGSIPSGVDLCFFCFIFGFSNMIYSVTTKRKSCILIKEYIRKKKGFIKQYTISNRRLMRNCE